MTNNVNSSIAPLNKKVSDIRCWVGFAAEPCQGSLTMHHEQWFGSVRTLQAKGFPAQISEYRLPFHTSSMQTHNRHLSSIRCCWSRRCMGVARKWPLKVRISTKMGATSSRGIQTWRPGVGQTSSGLATPVAPAVVAPAVVAPEALVFVRVQALNTHFEWDSRSSGVPHFRQRRDETTTSESGEEDRTTIVDSMSAKRPATLIRRRMSTRCRPNTP